VRARGTEDASGRQAASGPRLHTKQVSYIMADPTRPAEAPLAMTDLLLFPFQEYWWFYACFTVFVLAVLALDLGVFHREAHEVSAGRPPSGASSGWRWRSPLTTCSTSTPCGTCRRCPRWQGSTTPARPGYRLEFLAATWSRSRSRWTTSSCSSRCSPTSRCRRATSTGAVLRDHRRARVPRAVHLARLGAHAVQVVVLIFGVFLIATGFKILFLPEKPIDPSATGDPAAPAPGAGVARIEGEKFWVRHEGVLYATPLFVALVFIEFSDIIFAIDSVPAIFALTNEPLIVFTRTSSPSSACARCFSCWRTPCRCSTT